MKRNLVLAVAGLVVALAAAFTQHVPSTVVRADTAADNAALEQAIQAHAEDVPVEGSGHVVKVLPDDDEGSRHQRFLVRLSSGETILIAHNIDLASRVAPLAAGDAVSFGGEFVWNAKGGVVHWTHRDPSGRHRAGWIRRDGQLFQ
jgi:hypothetical protein